MVHGAPHRRISMDDLARPIFVANPKMVAYMQAHHQEEGFSFLALMWWWYISIVLDL
jgi:hypothetical protein